MKEEHLSDYFYILLIPIILGHGMLLWI